MNSVLRHTDNTAVVDPRFGTAATPIRPSAWATVDGADPGAVVLYASGDTTGATDRAAIQAAIDNATETQAAYDNTNAFFTGGKPASIVLIGKFWINGPIIMKQGVWLRGQSWLASTIHLAPGSNSSMITWPDKTYWTGVEDLHLDGHAETQTAGGPAVNCTAGGAVTVRGDSCTAPFIQRVMVTYAYDTAFMVSAVEARIADCYAYRAGKYGFELASSDSFMHGCASGDSRNAGFLVSGGQHHVSNCKSWWSGYYQPDRTKLASGNQTHFEPGFRVRGASNMFVNCDAQDTSGVGWHIEGEENILRNCVSDSSRTGHFLLWGAAANCTIEGHCRSVHKNTAGYAVKIEAWSATTNNHISVDFPDTRFNGELLTAQGLVLSGAAAAGADQRNVIRIGTPERTYTTAYAPTITPDPLFGGVDVTLTGDVTIANTVADRSIHGTELSIMLTQDATGGRTVTWGSDYVGMTAASTDAGMVSVWRIRRVKGRWVQNSFNTY